MQVFVEGQFITGSNCCSERPANRSCSHSSACILHINTVFRECCFITEEKYYLCFLKMTGILTIVKLLPSLYRCCLAPALELKDHVQHLEEFQQRRIKNAQQAEEKHLLTMENNRHFPHDSICNRPICSEVGESLLGFASQNRRRKKFALTVQEKRKYL